MIHGIDHVNLVVADLDRSVAFYTGVLGRSIAATNGALSNVVSLRTVLAISGSVDDRFGLGGEPPQGTLTHHHLGNAGGDAQPDPAVVLARLHQQDAVSAGLGQAIGQCATGRAGADYDEVKGFRGGRQDRIARSRGRSGRVGPENGVQW
jgi:catechol 2,3-dioxygenase-like lactoylglutathione lyase family enzyme